MKKQITYSEYFQIMELMSDKNADMVITDVTVMYVGENIFLRSSWNNFDILSNWYTSQEAEESGWKIKGATEEDITELTLEQIAEKFGKDVKKIKIKK